MGRDAAEQDGERDAPRGATSPKRNTKNARDSSDLLRLR
jgi:hypothetical protein